MQLKPLFKALGLPARCRIVMPCDEKARQHFLCDGALREYVAGRNKLLLIHCVLRSDHSRQRKLESDERPGFTRKDTRNA